MNATPWDFRYRGMLFGVIYGFAFNAGFIIQSLVGGSFDPTYAVLTQRFGDLAVHASAWFAAALCFVGFFIRWWGASYLSSGVVWSGDVVAGGVEVAGPYRYVRNPLYVGNLFIALGMGLAGPPAVTLLVFALNLAFIYRLIFVEERYLERTQGAAYRAYCAAVPRLFPRPASASPGVTERRPAVLDGLVGEIFTLGFAVGMASVALGSWRQPNFILMMEIFIGGIVVQIALRRIMRTAGSAER